MSSSPVQLVTHLTAITGTVSWSDFAAVAVGVIFRKVVALGGDLFGGSTGWKIEDGGSRTRRISTFERKF